MPYPAPALLQWLFLWCLVAGLASLTPWAQQIPWMDLWIGMGFAVGLFALFDMLRLRRIPVPLMQRQVRHALSVGVWHKIKLEIENSHTEACEYTIFDDFPQPAEQQGLPQQIRLQSGQRAILEYNLCIQQRGPADFSQVHIRIRSPWGLWWQHIKLPVKDTTKVYPNFAAVSGYALLATENRLGQLGIRKQPRRGEGLEFHQLREYRPGDALRQLDWNATSRQRKLISREYQDERDQQVIFLLDCGRRMRTQDDRLSHFDHSLNAMLLLSYVALRQGDALGLLSFSGSARWLAPRKGLDTLSRLLNSVYDLQPGMEASDYVRAVEQFLHKQRRRALVIILSNLRDEDNESLVSALRLLQRKHLVLFASLQEQALNQTVKQGFEDFEGALQHAATLSYLKARRSAHEVLRQYGAYYLDTEPEHLPAALVNYYLEIKRSGLL